MNKRIKKKKAKQALLREQERLAQELAQLSPEELEELVRIVRKGFHEISKVIAYIFDGLIAFLKIWRNHLKVLNNRELYNLDQELFKFRGIDRAIWVRRAELMSSNGEEIVGSRGGGISKPTESTVIKLSTDVPLRNLELFKETVETFMKELTVEQRDIFELRWGQSCLDWEEIAEKMHISTATVYRKRNNILETYARTKGIL